MLDDESEDSARIKEKDDERKRRDRMKIRMKSQKRTNIWI